MLQPLFILQQILEIYLMSNILDFTEKNLQKQNESVRVSRNNVLAWVLDKFAKRYKRTRWKQSANVPNDSHATLEL